MNLPMRIRFALVPLQFLIVISAAFAATETSFEFREGDRVVLIGDTLIEREGAYGYIEQRLTSQFPDRNVQFRNLGWSGDTPQGTARASFDFDKPGKGFEKLKEAVQQQRPIQWVKVHNLPDFVYFNHSQHVVSGVACQSCHGPVETMDRVKQVAPLTMGWCLQCHREQAKIPTGDFARATLSLSKKQKPVAGLDCASCHY